MLEDARYALRQFRKAPGFAAIAIVTLGLGIGAASAMFSLVQGVLLAPPPYEEPDRVVLLSSARANGEPYIRGITIAQWQAWRQARTIEPPVLYAWRFNFLVEADGSESLGGMAVTTNYFATLGLQPMLGRVPTDVEAARPKVLPTAVVIGHHLWQRKFQGNPNVIGQPLALGRMPGLVIVGVMPPDIRFLPDLGAAAEPNYDVNARVDFWYAMTPDETRPATFLHGVTRLREGASLEEARAEIASADASAAQSDPLSQGLTGTVTPLQEALNREGRALLVPLFGAVALLFFIACANVAGLLLARGLQRQQGYAMRAALGAGRRRIVRQVLTETAVLALVGALVGWAVAASIVAVLKAIGDRAVPRADAVSLGWPVLVFGVAAALVAVGIAGVLPALRASFGRRFTGLSGVRASVGRIERRWLGAVATLQIVLTIALLAGAALLIRTAQNLERVGLGYETEHILAVTVTSVQQGQWQVFHRRVLAELAAVPGVRRAAFAWGVPLTGNKWPGTLTLPGQPGSDRPADEVNVPLRAVTPDYFDLFGIPLAEGRAFRDADDEKGAGVAIVNEAMARRHFDGRNPIGQQLRFVGNNPPIEIVGMIADTRTETPSQPAEPEVYLPLWQMQAFSKHLVLRAAGDPLALADQVRAAIKGAEPTAAVERMTTMAEIRRTSTAPRTFAMRLLVGFAVAATLLAIIGVYGVLALSVGSRTKEIAVRKAIGAQAHQIARLVLGDLSMMIAVGFGLGVIAALGLGRLLQAMLFDVHFADPLSLAAAGALFAIAALVACALPVRRAGRVDLMDALRQE